MSAEKPIEWVEECPAAVFDRARMVVMVGNCVKRDATRADLDKALDALGLRAVSRHMTVIGEVALEKLRDKADGYDEVREERDAAIAAKEATEKGVRIAEQVMTRVGAMQTVVEAARVFCEEMRTMGGSSTGQLDAALRALDAGEAPRPQGDAYRIGPAACHHPRNCATCMAAQAIAKEEIEKLRSALARAEEQLESAKWRERYKQAELDGGAFWKSG